MIGTKFYELTLLFADSLKEIYKAFVKILNTKGHE